MEWRFEVDALPFVSLITEVANSLELPFKDEEVYDALPNFSGDKALRPDGLLWPFSKPPEILLMRELWSCLENFMLMGPSLRVLIPCLLS